MDEKMVEKTYEFLEAKGVDVLRITDDISDDDIILEMEGDEDELENIDLSIPEGISIEDPVRMYLKRNW